MSSCQLMFPGGVPWSQGLDLSLLLPVIGLIFTVVSKLLLYSTTDKTLKHQVNSTKQLLNAGRGHQAPRRATQLFERR